MNKEKGYQEKVDSNLGDMDIYAHKTINLAIFQKSLVITDTYIHYVYCTV